MSFCKRSPNCNDKPKTIAQLIPELDKLLKLSSEPARRLTFRCLYEVAEKASPATVSLIENLDHRDYWFRSESHARLEVHWTCGGSRIEDRTSVAVAQDTGLGLVDFE